MHGRQERTQRTLSRNSLPKAIRLFWYVNSLNIIHRALFILTLKPTSVLAIVRIQQPVWADSRLIC